MGLQSENARRIVLDVETVALPDAAVFVPTPRAPKSYKDDAKIKSYIQEKYNEEVEHAGLDPDLGCIVAIGVMMEGTDEPSVVSRAQYTEEFMLDWLWKSVGPRITVGFNTLGFDLPMCLRRSLYLGVPTPNINLDKYRTPHLDLQQILSFRGVFKYRSLDFYCRRFDLKVPDDSVVGADIPKLVAEGNWAAVEDHCASDVKKTAALARRMGLLYQPTTLPEPEAVL